MCARTFPHYKCCFRHIVVAFCWYFLLLFFLILFALTLQLRFTICIQKTSFTFFKSHFVYKFLSPYFEKYFLLSFFISWKHKIAIRKQHCESLRVLTLTIQPIFIIAFNVWHNRLMHKMIHIKIQNITTDEKSNWIAYQNK